MNATWQWDNAPRLNHSAAALLVAPHLGVDPGNLTPFGEGDFCLALLSGDRLVRVAKHEEAAAALRREACVMPAIAGQLPLAVPLVSCFERDDCPPYTVHSLVPGQSLSRRMWEGYEPGEREAIAVQLAGFLDALHALSTQPVQRCGLPHATLDSLLERIAPGADEAVLPRLSDEAALLLEREYNDWTALAKDSPPPVILHCDIDPAHVLVSGTTRRLSGVIDFGDMSIGDQARDFIFIYEDFGPEMLAAVLRHYGRENGGELQARIRAWYLFDLVSWILAMHSQHNEAEVARGIRTLTSELGA